MIWNTNHQKQRWNIFVFLLSPIDNVCRSICHPTDEDSYVSTSDDSSSSSLIAASNVFGDANTIASSMSSLSLNTFDKQVRENWRRARKLQKKNHRTVSLLDYAYTEDENEDTDEQLKKAVATPTMKATSTRPPLSPPNQEKRKKKKQKSHAPKTRPLLSLSRPPLSPPPKQEKKKSRLVLAREKMYGKHKSNNTGKQQQKKEILL